MFNTDAYCQRYLMRKEASVGTAFTSWLGNKLSGVGRGINFHFGYSRAGRAIGGKLTNWGDRMTNQAYNKLWKQYYPESTRSINSAGRVVDSATTARPSVSSEVIDVPYSTTPHPADSPEVVSVRNETNAANNTTEPAKKMGLGKKIAIGTLGFGAPLAIGTGIGYHMGSNSQEQQYVSPSQLAGY